MCDHIDSPCDCPRGAAPMDLPDPVPLEGTPGFTRTSHLTGGTLIHARALQRGYSGIERALGDLAVAEEHKVAAIREVAQSVRAVAWVVLLIAGLVLAVVA